jgi:hypothetical protein
VVQTSHRRVAVALAVSTSALAVLAAVVLTTWLSQPAYIMPSGKIESEPWPTLA